MKTNMKFNTRQLKIIAGIALAVAVIVIACAVYIIDYYHADMKTVTALAPVDTVEMHTDDNENYIVGSESAPTGLIFYPGGKVEYTAYLPLMQQLATEDIMCVLVKMPFNLAVLDISAAEGIQEKYPEIGTWYIGGHSLGGSMAASYLADNESAFSGLILLSSYSTEDLSDSSLNVLSIYGSEDKVLDADKYEESKANLPEDFSEVVIDGGCHAYFGVYGMQEGDGIPAITNEEQIIMTVNAITDSIKQEE